jgi:hypothetical protein
MELIDQGTSARILLDRTEPFFRKKNYSSFFSFHSGFQASGPGRGWISAMHSNAAPALVTGEW